MPARSLVRFLSLCILLLPVSLFVTDAKTLLLDESDDNSHLWLYSGDLLAIRLASNPTTGYSWSNPDSPVNLELLSSKSERGSSDSPGASGFQVFSFKATKPGDSALILTYLRPFEKDTPPVKKFRLTITVEPRPAYMEAVNTNP